VNFNWLPGGIWVYCYTHLRESKETVLGSKEAGDRIRKAQFIRFKQVSRLKLESSRLPSLESRRLPLL
jgi:hypothetical protein